jgi:hypothetical protein
MIAVYTRYAPEEIIPIDNFIKNKKTKKYFSKETSASLTAMGMLLEKANISEREIPIYYSTGDIEFEDYGLQYIVEDSKDANGNFSDQLFIEKGLSRISPINQFKVLQNMPLSFIAIEFGFTGDNAVIYASALGLIQYALHSKKDQVILGAGKTYKNGSVEAGFALLSKQELMGYGLLAYQGEATGIFKDLCSKKEK